MFLTSNYYTATVLKKPDIGLKTDRRPNGNESKTQILTPTSTGFLTMRQKISNGERKHI